MFKISWGGTDDKSSDGSSKDGDSDNGSDSDNEGGNMAHRLRMGLRDGSDSSEDNSSSDSQSSSDSSDDSDNESDSDLISSSSDDDDSDNDERGDTKEAEALKEYVSEKERQDIDILNIFHDDFEEDKDKMKNFTNVMKRVSIKRGSMMKKDISLLVDTKDEESEEEEMEHLKVDDNDKAEEELSDESDESDSEWNIHGDTDISMKLKEPFLSNEGLSMKPSSYKEDKFGESKTASFLDTSIKAEHHLSMIGIPLDMLQALIPLAHARDLKEITTRVIVKRIIKPFTKRYRCSFTDLLNDPVKSKNVRESGLRLPRLRPVHSHKVANVFVCHAWDYTFEGLVAALETFQKNHEVEEKAKGQGRPTELYFWIDIMCINQWKPICTRKVTPPTRWFSNTFPRFLMDIGHLCVVLLPWNKPIVFSRIWCLYEMIAARKAQIEVSIQFAADRHDNYIEMLEDHYDKARKIIDSMLIDPQTATTRAAGAREEIYWNVFYKIKGGRTSIVNDIIKESMQSFIRKRGIVILGRKAAKLENTIGRYIASNEGQWSNTMQNSIFCNAFGCSEVFDYTSDIRNNQILLMTTEQRIARLLMEDGRLEEAKDLYFKVMRDSEKICGPNHISTITLLGNIAFMYKKLGDGTQADVMFRRCLAKKEAVLGQAHESTMSTVIAIAGFLREEKKFSEAISFLQRVLGIQQEEFGQMDVSTLITWEDLASLYLEMNNYEAVINCLEKILTGRSYHLGKAHPNSVSVMESIASLHMQLKSWDASREYFEKALHYRRISNGDMHATTLADLYSLARLEHKAENFEKAKEYYSLLLEGTRLTVGPKHFRVYQLKHKLIIVDERLNSTSNEDVYDELASLYKEANNEYGLIDPVVLTIGQHLSEILFKLSRYEEAVVISRGVVRERQNLFGESNIYTLLSKYGLAVSLAHMKQFREAYALYDDLISKFDKHRFVGPEDAKTITALRSYIDICDISMDYARQEQLLRRLIPVYQRMYGADDEKTIELVQKLSKAIMGVGTSTTLQRP